jgi:hypothetical protein
MVSEVGVCLYSSFISSKQSFVVRSLWSQYCIFDVIYVNGVIVTTDKQSMDLI